MPLIGACQGALCRGGLNVYAASNFAFLAAHSPHILRLNTQAERYLHEDPNTCLIKLRQFGELLVQQLAAKVGHYTSNEDNLLDTINGLRSRNDIAQDVASLFHGRRKAGNAAALNHGVFKSYGGFQQINKAFAGQLDQVLADLQDQVWKDVG